MTKNLTSILGALLALALIASACGGDDASSSDQAVIDAVATQIGEDDDVPEDVDIDCMASAIVAGLGGGEAMETNHGLTTQTISDGQDVFDVELPKDDAIELASDTMECGLGDAVVTEMAGDGMAEDDAKCLFESLDQDVLRDMLATQFMNDADAAAIEETSGNEFNNSLLSAVVDCDIDINSFG